MVAFPSHPGAHSEPEEGRARPEPGLRLAILLGTGAVAAFLLGALALHGITAPQALLDASGTEEPGAASWAVLWFVAAAGAAGLGGGAALRGHLRVRALRQENAALRSRLMAFTELSPAFDLSAVILRSPDGVIRHWSAGCERLFGFTAAEALGRLCHELLSTRFPDGGRRTVQEELLRRGEWRGELRHRRRNGGPVVVASHWILRRDPQDGRPLAVIEVHADATALKTAEAALRAGEARLRLAQEVAGVGIWEWDPEEDLFVWSPEQHALFGLPPGAPAPCTLEAFLALIHPDDRVAVRAAAFAALDSGEYEVEFRVPRVSRNGAETIQWLIGRGRRMPGLAGRMGAILGVNVDITARKQAEQQQALLMREVDHRAKNALAVVQAVLRLTRADSARAFAKAVEGRVAALARAQTLLTESRWAGAGLASILRGELAPFMGSGGMARVVLEGPPVTLVPEAAQPLSMTLHELTTNAAKYGSLSVPGGSVSVSWRTDDREGCLRLRWAEAGGPLITGPPARRGFGSRVVEATIRDQLGGTLVFRWEASGLVCELAIPMDRVLASGPDKE
ncbi:sensor histidine kinase [Crenalkalicoccus roseus]|uniref:sensor histidine kinase n=1 Tax=Crenalkalicoccus roseus TaxID=1485588 RepID=UPI0013051774|nr:HWE histidine kinase domain-containing protein [Crenalkalicoccus roseus]